MVTKQSNMGELMTLTHKPLVIDGDRVGDMVTLDTKIVFYTTDAKLAHLDGQRFDDEIAVASAVRAAQKNKTEVV